MKLKKDHYRARGGPAHGAHFYLPLAGETSELPATIPYPGGRYIRRLWDDETEYDWHENDPDEEAA